jgi:uncharacterized C2H2 Zn-finger protein
VPRRRLDGETDRFEPADELAHVLPHLGFGFGKTISFASRATTGGADDRSGRGTAESTSSSPCKRAREIYSGGPWTSGHSSTEVTSPLGELVARILIQKKSYGLSQQRKDLSMSPRKRSAARAESGQLVCPECGKTFTRPASLGAHRNRAHGVAGSSKAAASASGKTSARASKRDAAGSRATGSSGARSKRAASSRKRATTLVVSGTSRQRAARAQGAGSDGTRRLRRSSADSRSSSVDRDGLLQSLFPAGIPAREDAIRQVNAWLDEAERLVRMR